MSDRSIISVDKPCVRPSRAKFSCGPTAKFNGWTVNDLVTEHLGRSHRSDGVRSLVNEIKALQQDLLGIPDDWVLILTPASDTGAFEAAMWNLLGKNGVDVLVWDSFGSGWAKDIKDHLQLKDVRVLEADYGKIPDLNLVDAKRDVVFTWNGTTSGVCVPDAAWLRNDREGLVLCDATSALFAMDLDWQKMDVVTWSWQKALGGEAQHGMLAMSPRAVARLIDWTPPWPLPKIFRIKSRDGISGQLADGDTINTPSLLALADYHLALEWAKKAGGQSRLTEQCKTSLSYIASWVDQTDWVEFLCADAQTRSWTSVCLTLTNLSVQEAEATVKSMVSLLAQEKVAYDIKSYREAPPGLRIWCGPTIPTADVTALLPWLDWAYHTAQTH